MTVSHEPLPGIARDDAPAVAVTEWAISTPERQRDLCTAIAAAWEHAAMPPGLLAQSVLASSEGTSLLYYSQWADPAECARVVADGGPEWMQRVAELFPAIEREPLIAYERYRSDIPVPDAPPPGCIVAVRVRFDTNDPSVTREWVDEMFALGAAQPDPVPGLYAAHFHVSDDGSRVLNYAEWADEASHARMMQGGPGDEPAGEPTADEQRVYNWPGLRGFMVTRYRPAATQVVPAAR